MADILDQRWYIVIDDQVGGYAIANVDKDYTSELDWTQGDTTIGEFISEEVALLIVKQQNLRLDIREEIERARS